MALTQPSKKTDLWEINLSPAQRAEILNKRSLNIAAAPTETSKGQTLDLLTFLMGPESYAIEVMFVREVYPLGHITPVPRTPNFVHGLFNARGQLISVVDLRLFMGLSPCPLNEESKIIVVANEQMELGLLSTDVIDTKRCFAADLDPPFALHDAQEAEFVKGIAPGMVVVLNLPIILTHPRLIINQV
jgi:purine-binding chemotaxis protein CheW